MPFGLNGSGRRPVKKPTPVAKPASRWQRGKEAVKRGATRAKNFVRRNALPIAAAGFIATSGVSAKLSYDQIKANNASIVQSNRSSIESGRQLNEFRKESSTLAKEAHRRYINTLIGNPGLSRTGKELFETGSRTIYAGTFSKTQGGVPYIRHPLMFPVEGQGKLVILEHLKNSKNSADQKKYQSYVQLAEKTALALDAFGMRFEKSKKGPNEFDKETGKAVDAYERFFETLK